ncbi:MAG TPA: cupin domain-containing protein [Sphingomonas sp.]|uniref:cupin domain-containing protein n=1 Tax=Sphingomonas sp. TaxID=28214 RepID=UPI002ED7A7E6
MEPGFQRVVTTHDAKGNSVVRSIDMLEPQTIASGDAAFRFVWATPTVPADMNGDHDGRDEAGLTLSGGSVFRMVDLLPGRTSPMHRSFSIDYGIVLSGALELVLDGGDRIALKAGDVVVQRGTNHLWHNPSPDTPCRIAFVLIEAAPIVCDGRVMEEVHP